jgi:hypothetical protein
MPKVLKRANEHGGTGVVGLAGGPISQTTQMLLIYLLATAAIPFLLSMARRTLHAFAILFGVVQVMTT